MDAPFPTDPAEFDADERISFSKLDSKFLAVLDDGTEFEFDADAKRWVPAEDDDAGADIDANADTEDYGGARPLDWPAAGDESKKRKNGPEDEAAAQTEKRKPARGNKRQKGPPAPRQNTAIYVTGLPDDATVDEVHDLFSRKGGVIAEEIDSGAPRIKLYRDSEGKFKGDALIVFFKPQSVEMAIMLLDDTDFRIAPSGAGQGRMRVQAADTSYKKVQQHDEAGEGEGKQQQQQPQQRRNDRDRQKIIKKTQKLDAKLADWDDDEPYAAAGGPGLGGRSSKWDKVVILSHMFTLEELEEDPAALLEIKEDVRDECAKLGTVTNVVLFDREPEGIVSVKFRDADAAEACVRAMRGRSFDGRVVEAYLATGRERFQRSGKGDEAEEESE